MRTKITYIEWFDAKVYVDHTDNFDLPIMTSVGFLIRQDKEKILLASLLGTNKDIRIVTVIPAVLIKKIKTIFISH